MSGRWFHPNFHVESFLRSIKQESHILHRSELSGDHFHEWAMGDDFVGMIHVESFLRSIIQESHINSQKWAIWRPFSWVGDDFVDNFHVESFLRSITQDSHINHRSELSGDHFHEWAMISSKFSCREFLEIYNTREATSFTEVSYLETTFMSARRFRPNFHVESFVRSIMQENHINHRSDLSGDHFHEWAMILSKISCREFLEIYNTREPQHSQKWAIWRPFSWVGDGFVQIFMSRVSWDLLIQESHINHRSDLSGDHFHEWAMILSKFSFREFLGIY